MRHPYPHPHHRPHFMRRILFFIGLIALFSFVRHAGYQAGWQEGFYIAQMTEGGSNIAPQMYPGYHGGFSFFRTLITFGFLFLFIRMIGKFAFKGRHWAKAHHRHHRGHHRHHDWSGPKPPWWDADRPDRHATPANDESDYDDEIPPHKKQNSA